MGRGGKDKNFKTTDNILLVCVVSDPVPDLSACICADRVRIAKRPFHSEPTVCLFSDTTTSLGSSIAG